MESNAKNLNDYLAILNRRKIYILLTWILVTTIAVIVAYNLPKVFRSTATMLMQAPMPEKLSDTTGHLYADEQIQTVYQKVLTTQNILSIIKEHGLFENEEKDGRASDSSNQSDLVTEFKESTEVEIATSSLANSNAKFADIVFNISFSYETPEKAKAIVSALAKLLIEYNDKSRTQRALKITDFLVEELEKLNQKSQELDGKIATYKEQHIFNLPDQIQGNMAAIDRMESELRDTDSQIRNTKDRILYLEAELARAQTDYASASDDGKKPKTKEETLRILKAKYAQLSSIYSPSHPDVIRIKRELKALSVEAEFGQLKEEIIKRLTESKNELRVLQESYKDNHPEVVKRKIELDNLERQLKNAKTSASVEAHDSLHSSNPAFLAVDVQLNNSKSELQSLIQKQEYLKSKLDNTKNLLSMTPKVEVEYTDMIRERDSTIKKYNQLKEKWLDAKLVQSIEQEQQGQTLTILEPPNLPMHQEKAIRKKVAVGGCIFGLFAGIGLALLIEYFDPAVRGYRSVIEITGLKPIIVIPYIDSLSEQAGHLEEKKQIIQFKVWVIILNIILITAAFIYFLFLEGFNKV
ncbi:MAG: lipopolysaccharide biosynthesis protein [Methylococcaceae bacterium]|nr:lipopolysaccharide biosynthesis protein [Methylococcaceae bacterium]